MADITPSPLACRELPALLVDIGHTTFVTLSSDRWWQLESLSFDVAACSLQEWIPDPLPKGGNEKSTWYTFRSPSSPYINPGRTIHCSIQLFNALRIPCFEMIPQLREQPFLFEEC